jgi:hypothetical protein
VDVPPLMSCIRPTRWEITPIIGRTAMSPGARDTAAAVRPSMRACTSSAEKSPPCALKARKPAMASSFSGCMAQGSAAKAERMCR